MTIPDAAVRAAQEATEGGFGITDDYMIAALTAALPFMQGVKVKALTWRSEPPYHMARTKFGGFYCIEAIWNENKFVHAKLDGSFSSGKIFPTLEEAKSSAQSDYEARVLSSLDVSELDNVEPIADKSRFENTARNLILNRTLTDLENIINGHDPEIGNLNNDVWDRLDKMSLEIEALSTPSPRAHALEELLSELKEAERKIFSWSGSAFVANELEGAEDADCKSEIYNDLCKLGNVMSWLQTQVSALSHPVSPDMGVERPVEGGPERGKFYHKDWELSKLLEARNGGLVDHSGGEAWRYEYTSKDENGVYDMLYRHNVNASVPVRLPQAPGASE
ncbi:hypothetical protein [Ochrobactrum sp. Marseille-Q0166]|uniref:hypothetical protein n=1 Tax=Ochrobactrum sp. Marseille-Q0166 TaxID=2761105 RepID=UPI0016551C03|nr:hypothetical protein [Ochrobactrum sp. Marseille-Q0166]MBC8718778.1 hypothetical protein [Ochrobactrum sp. Marseille-Q0166]